VDNSKILLIPLLLAAVCLEALPRPARNLQLVDSFRGLQARALPRPKVEVLVEGCLGPRHRLSQNRYLAVWGLLQQPEVASCE
jgi:hypothetical protein